MRASTRQVAWDPINLRWLPETRQNNIDKYSARVKTVSVPTDEFHGGWHWSLDKPMLREGRSISVQDRRKFASKTLIFLLRPCYDPDTLK